MKSRWISRKLATVAARAFGGHLCCPRECKAVVVTVEVVRHLEDVCLVQQIPSARGANLRAMLFGCPFWRRRRVGQTLSEPSVDQTGDATKTQPRGKPKSEV